MNPITHLLVSWTVAEGASLERRDRTIVSWVGLAPDLDGLGAVPDVIARSLGLADPAYFGRFHHVLLHGAFGAVVLALAGAAASGRRLRTFFWGLLAVHVHLLCDLVGSRGPSPDDIWPILYLAPFRESPVLSWPGQWPLNAWQNILITLALIGLVFVRAVRSGRSPVELVSLRANEAFVSTVRARWDSLRSGPKAP